jgi:heme-degrading monooxygenase HmoA
MIAIIFEVKIEEGSSNDYLAIAAELRPILEKIEGFVSIERFQSLTDPDKLLSLSFFESEEAVEQWRNLSAHREAQSTGRQGIFKDYRIRVAEVVRDYGMFERDQVPEDSKETFG